MTNLDVFQRLYGKWANETFGSVLEEREPGLLNHLKEEAQEFIDNPCGEEAADIVMLLLHWCHMSNVSLLDELEKKWRINKTRTWTQHPDGRIKHVEGNNA